MAFLFEELHQQFVKSISNARLAHAYLLTAPDRDALEKLARSLADLALGDSHRDHPDFHLIKPESKSRRITVDQVRLLEGELHLKSFMARRKVGIILDAERMCLGQAEPANAFLKTLEEPPAEVVLLLCSSQPQALLPTILSRCIRLELNAPGRVWDDPVWLAFLAQWNGISQRNAASAYKRVQLLMGVWQKYRESIETEYADAMESAEDESSEEAIKALIEGENLQRRNDTVAQLQRWYWARAEQSLPEISLSDPNLRAIGILAELQAALQTNVDLGLALERAFLAIEGALEPQKIFH